MGRQTPRDRLLVATLDHVARHGVADLSLRELAAAIGTSHRMLIYHFGSKEELLVAVVQAVEEQQRAQLTTLTEESTDPVEAARRHWRGLTDPALAPNERLFFELYAQALAGKPGTTTLLDGIVETWLEPAATGLERMGLNPDDARAEARLGVAVVRGLLFDLLATGDRTAIDAAFERHLTRTAALLAQVQSQPST